MADIYCICCKQLSSNNYRNVFDKKLLINSQEKVKHEEPDGYMTLRNAIELITGYTISETDNAILCETCFHKVESYIKFRSQLVASFGKLSDTEVSDLSLENVDIANINSLISNASNTDSEISKEIMNIKRKDNISPNCSNLSSIEAENDSLSYPAPIFHHFVDVADIVSDNVSDNISDYVSDYGSDIDDNLNVDISCSKSDIESDVNVCSGEDDEVLELSVDHKYNQVRSISSTESEEDYDYGPTFKKIKLTNRISSPLILS